MAADFLLATRARTKLLCLCKRPDLILFVAVPATQAKHVSAVISAYE